VDLLKQQLQLFLERFVLGALVELAHKMPSGLQDIEGEL
jgi:hypothetical protein